MDVSIIVVAWNVKDLLYNCLKSTFEETKEIEFEVIYVDNASKDGSVEMVKKEFPAVKIIENEENKGFIIANNQGIEIAKGRYILLLNSDTIILENAITKSVMFADQHPDAAVIGCKTLNPDGSLQRSAFMCHSVLNMFLYATYLYNIFPKSRFFGREFMTWWEFEDTREVETVRGCFALVRRAAIERVGLMDDTYFVYGDDIDWCYRFRKEGWKVIFTPIARIVHYGGQTTKKQLTEKFLFQLYGSKLIFMRKYKSKLEFIIAIVLVSLFFFIRVPYWFLVGCFSKKRTGNSFRFAKVYFKGCLLCLFDWKRLLMNREAVKGKL